MAYQMPGPATASGSSNVGPTTYPSLVSTVASHPPRQGSKRSYDEYDAQDSISSTSRTHNLRAGPASAMENTQEHPSKRFRGDSPLPEHRSATSGSSSGLNNQQTASNRTHAATSSCPSFPDASGSSLYRMPVPQPCTTFHLTDPVIVPAFPEPHQAIPQTHWQYPSVEPRIAPSQQATDSRAAAPPRVEPHRQPNSSADVYARDASAMDWSSSSMNNGGVSREASRSRQAPPPSDLSGLNRHSERPSAIPPLPNYILRRSASSNPSSAHAHHASLLEGLPESGHQLPPVFLPANPPFEDTSIPYGLPSSSIAPAPPIINQPMPTPSTRAPQSRMNLPREPPSVVHHSTHDSHDLGPSASHRSMTYTRRPNLYSFLQPTTSSPSRLRPEELSSRPSLFLPNPTSSSRSSSRLEMPRLNEPSHQVDHWIDRPYPEPSSIPRFDMPTVSSPLHIAPPPVTTSTTTTTTTTTSTTTRRMSTRAAQRVQEWRQELPSPSSPTGPSTTAQVYQRNDSLWDTLLLPTHRPPSPPIVAPPLPERSRRRTRTRDSPDLFDVPPFAIHPSPHLLDLDDHDVLSFLGHQPIEPGDAFPYDPMMVPLPSTGGSRPRRARRRNTNTNTGVNGSGTGNADVNMNDDADPMWNNMATLRRLRRATAGAGDTSFGENTSGAIANHRDRIAALMRATFGRRAMRLGRMPGFGSMGDFVHDDDFDDSYEALMRLSAMIGDVRKGVSSDVLDKLPKGKFSEFVDAKGKGKDKEQEGDLACAICLEEYKDDDECVKMVKCRHFYHAECIQQWLQNASTCPICREGVEEERVQPFGSPQIITTNSVEAPINIPSSRNNRNRQGSGNDASGSSSSVNTASGLAAQWTRAQHQPNESPLDWAARLMDTIPDFESIPGGTVGPSHEDFGTVRRRAQALPHHEDWLFDEFVPPAPTTQGPVSAYDEDPDMLFRPPVSERSTRRSSGHMRAVEPIRIAPSPQPVVERVAIPPPLPPMVGEENHNSGLASWIDTNSRPQQAPQFVSVPQPQYPHPHLHSGTPQPHLPNAHSLSVVGSSLLAAATAAACPHIARDGQSQHRRYEPPQHPPPISHPAPSSSSSSRWRALPSLPTFGLGSGSRNGSGSGHTRASSTGSQRLGSSLHIRRPSSPAPISRSIDFDLADD